MKKKNRVQMLAALLAATLSMVLASPIAAKADEEYNEDATKASNADTGRIYYLKNSHGDVIGQMDENGTVLTSYAYNAFGEQVSTVAIQGNQKSISNQFLYAGEQYDESSGFYYLRARHYDAKAGRFTQEDTYLGDGRNLYAYVHSNPLKYVDPTGHATQANADGDTNLLNDEKVYDGGSSSVTVNYNGVQSPVYRGGNTFTASNSEVRFDSAGNVKATRGVSVNVNPNAEAITQHGGAYQVQSMPNELSLVQVGKDAGHYEIVPTYPMPMSTYQNYLNEIETEAYKGD